MTAATVSRTEASVGVHRNDAKGSRWPSRIQAGEVMSAPVEAIDASASLWEAARRLFGDGEAHLVVMDGSRPVGVVNEAIVALQWPCAPLNAYRREIQDLTSRSVHTVLPDADIRKVAEIMLTDGVDAVPVVTPRGVVVGLVTARNLLELLAGCSSPTPWPDQDEEAAVA
jgi:CBS domain-containing protein